MRWLKSMLSLRSPVSRLGILASAVVFQALTGKVAAQFDPSCFKYCGAGSATGYATRACGDEGEGICFVTACSSHAGGCGYTDNFNDACGGGWLGCGGGGGS